MLFFAELSASVTRSTTNSGMPPFTCPASSMKRHSKPLCRAFHDK